MTAQHLHLVEEAADTAADERFQVLFRRYYGRVKGLAARRFPSCDSDDVAQETMVRVLLNAHRLDPQRDPWPYIAAIAVNVGRDLGRARVPEVMLTEESYERELAPAADEPVLRAERCAGVQKVLSGLAPGSRQVLALQAFEEMSVGEIAQFLGTNDNAVRQKLFRARHQFRRALAGVPSGAFGIGAVVARLRRRIAVANAAGGTGLSFTGAAMLAAAVAGAVTYVVSPGVSEHSALAPVRTVDVARLRAESGTLPEAADKSAVRIAPAAPVPARPALVAVAPDAAPVRVRVDTPGSLFKGGETTNSDDLTIDTPWGPVGTHGSGVNSPGPSSICLVIDRIGPC